MDEHRYDDWLNLWAKELQYWIPSNRNLIDPSRETSIIFNDRAGLEDRLARLKSGMAFAQSPRSRLTRLVTNVEIIDTDDDSCVQAGCCFLIHSVRRENEYWVTGRSMYELGVIRETFEIRAKTVYLTNIDNPIENLTYLI